MPLENFYAESVPYKNIEKLAIAGDGYSLIYPSTTPIAPIIGNWRYRYCTLSNSFKPILDSVWNFDVRADDIWIVTSTKCGTTWMQELIWLLLNNCNFKQAKSIDLTVRSPFLEFNGVVPNVQYDTIAAANALRSPRLIKSHLPAWLLPKQIWKRKPKIIYVYRNPKDAAISYYHHWRGMVGYAGTKEEFMQSYIDGHVNFNPFWPHVLDFWYMRSEVNIFFTSYERMKFDLGQLIKEMCIFLQKNINEQQLVELLEHLSFENMKNNPACNHVKEFESMRAATGRQVDEFRFVRRGIVGSHKDELSASVIQHFDEWSDNNLEPYNLTMNDFTNYSKYEYMLLK